MSDDGAASQVRADPSINPSRLACDAGASNSTHTTTKKRTHTQTKKLKTGAPHRERAPALPRVGPARGRPASGGTSTRLSFTCMHIYICKTEAAGGCPETAAIQPPTPQYDLSTSLPRPSSPLLPKTQKHKTNNHRRRGPWSGASRPPPASPPLGWAPPPAPRSSAGACGHMRACISQSIRSLIGGRVGGWMDMRVHLYIWEAADRINLIDSPPSVTKPLTQPNPNQTHSGPNAVQFLPATSASSSDQANGATTGGGGQAVAPVARA